jgi:hypothetical protein
MYCRLTNPPLVPTDSIIEMYPEHPEQCVSQIGRFPARALLDSEDRPALLLIRLRSLGNPRQNRGLVTPPLA